MALNKLQYNSLNVTPAAGKAVGFGSGADDLDASLSGGSIVFIKKLTASGSDTLSFVDGASSVVLDNTYKEYFITFKNIHPSEGYPDNAGNVQLTFNASIDAGSNYNVSKTVTVFDAYHSDADEGAAFRFHPSALGGSTDYQLLHPEAPMHDANKANVGGYMRLYNPSSTTYIKHFEAVINSNYLSAPSNLWIINNYLAGYLNTASAINAIQFKYNIGNFDAGDICLYGVN